MGWPAGGVRLRRTDRRIKWLVRLFMAQPQRSKRYVDLADQRRLLRAQAGHLILRGRAAFCSADRKERPVPLMSDTFRKDPQARKISAAGFPHHRRG